jgi:cytochrome c oxidase assembly factor CtaG
MTLALLHAGEPLAPHDLWTTWELDPLFTVPLVVTAILYGVGTRRLWMRAGTGGGISRLEALAFSGGWLALAIALVSPLHPLGGVLFSAHMTQHELLMVVAAPLLVLGQPNVAAAWALPRAWRQPASAWTHAPAVAGTWRWLGAPLNAWLVHALLLWTWHLPRLYEAALHSDTVHALQHACFLGSALVFWWVLLRARMHGRGAAVGYLFGAMVVTGALGALLTVAPTLWYPSYARTTLAWGLTALDDQQLGGMIMWMPGGASYLLAALWLMAGALREPARSASARS